MNDPKVITVASVLRVAAECATQLPDGRYVPARGCGWGGLRERFRCAWLVFTGRADALVWEGQPTQEQP